VTATLRSTDSLLAAFAAEVGETADVAVAGARTRWSVGGDLASGAQIVSAPLGIVEYLPEEMTVTVRCGTSVAELHAELAAKGQRTSLPDRNGTVGGALALGENDVRALGRGMLRAALLQIRYVSAEGLVVSGGGPTVKNVSGFDIPRLMVGALGTLGLLGEAIIRTNPIPPVSRWLHAKECDPGLVQDTLLAPSVVLWNGTSAWIQIEGHGADVDAQQATLADLGDFAEVDCSPDALPVDLPAHRWSLAPNEVAGLVRDSTFSSGDFVAAAGLGLVFTNHPQPPRDVSPEVALVAARLKENFDPTGRLNPGRDANRR
jgi:FAD/FMN-containing dehydrogenase